LATSRTRAASTSFRTAPSSSSISTSTTRSRSC